jgi:DNA repair ATPase RecN
VWKGVRVFRGSLGLAAAAIVAIAAFSGCGGGGSNGSSVSKAEFAKQAEVICERGQSKREAALGAALKNRPKGEKASFTMAAKEKLVTTAILPPIKAMSEELSELELPEQEEEEAAVVIASFEHAASQLESDPASLFSRESPLAEANAIAKKYGLEACSVF